MEILKDIWMIGNDFLRETMDALTSMTKSAKASKEPTPYMYQMFNIMGYFANFGSPAVLGIINPLIDALNDNHRLPEYILVIPDKDILTGLQEKKAATSFVIGSTLHYIIKQLDMFIQ